MKINGIETNAEAFAYDGCHKIYILENDKDLENALNIGYAIMPINMLEEIYNKSCELRFINNWKLNKTYAAQFENAVFESEV